MTVITLHKPRHKYGWNPDRPDHRDHFFAAPAHVLAALPTQVDLRPNCPPVYDQGQLGSCTSQAIAGAIEFDLMKQKLPIYTPSRLYIYYNERAMEGTVSSDSGARIRDGIKSVNVQGDCNEVLWPYDISQFAVKPPANCYQAGSQHKAVKYQRVLRNLNQMKGCLAAGLPFVFGISVYESFESPDVDASGDVPMPSPFESVLGGHALMMCGYSDSEQRFYFRNSWGTAWASNSQYPGYGTISYQYLLDPGLSSDFWAIQVVQ